MNTKIENISDTRKKIIVSFEPEQVVEQTEKMTKEFVKKAKISGFRPGKAPREMVEKTYANAIKEQVERELTNEAIKALNDVKDFDLYAVVDIQKEDVDGGVKMTFTADVYPEVKLPESLVTKVELEGEEASDEEVEKAVEYHRNQRAKYEEVDRAIKKGDFVRLSYKGTVDGVPMAEAAPELPLYADQKSTWEEAGNADAHPMYGNRQL